jgi:hypothetical protein
VINNSQSALYKKGLRRVLLFYSLGSVATTIFHFVVGWENAYAPPGSAVLFVFLFVIGILWAVLNLTSLLDARGRIQSLGELTVHIIVLIISTSLILMQVGAI